MSKQQTVKIRIEIGPGIPVELKDFDDGDAFAAILKGLFPVLTAERVYPGPDAAFTATYGAATVQIEPTGFDIRATSGLPSTLYTECTALVTLDVSDNKSGNAPLSARPIARHADMPP